ncbi:unnamed protein product [Psylliodes chrysocephalus]|uniref:Protein kinase domain-containing protein n=1 Tax=Psylliodes chrysocephalus TaxID=3402493 RepID=A0A9P0D3A5_9CUCU|nr:unnamed protein product [Psylliodes chrysocephala]
MPKDLLHVKNASDEEILLEKGYRLFKKIGEGSYAPVYLTEYIGKGTTEPKKLACKVIDLKKAPKDFVKKFLPRELEVLSLVNHPHIIHIQSIFQRKYRYYVFMSIADRGDLLDYLLVNGALNENRARVWFRQLALALQYLHEMGIAHRDLKCENCLISSNNNLKLADFGFARFVINEDGKNMASSTYCGSLNYAAPEVLKGSPYYPKISDCWSLGVILYAMLNKSMPFENKNVKELIGQQMNKSWKWRSKFVDILSEQVKSVVRQLLEPNSQLRMNIGEVMDSEWMKMDPRLREMTPDEERCLLKGREEQIRYIDKLRRSGKAGIGSPNLTSSKLKEIKVTNNSGENLKKGRSQKMFENDGTDSMRSSLRK